MSEMTDILNNDFPINLRLEEIVAYLQARGWQQVDAPKHPKLRVFEGMWDDNNKPLIVTMPRESGTVDEPRRINDILRTLASVQDQTIAAIAQEIVALHSDVMVWRIPNAEPDHTIPLDVAAGVITGLRDLLRYGASTEADPRPFFAKVTGIGTRYVEQCRLKPTRPGSFIFEVESPLEGTNLPGTDSVTQSDLFTDDQAINTSIEDQRAFHRRVMSRIALGLQNVAQKPESLVANYEQGFNANLCEALGEMLESVGDRGLEFSVRWSPAVQSPEISQEVIRFDATAIEYLHDAAKKLRAVKYAARITISGMVDRLSTSKTLRTITVMNGRVPIHVSLNPVDYRAACDAHRDRRRVQVSGVIEKRGRNRILTDISDFLVLPPVGTRG